MTKEELNDEEAQEFINSLSITPPLEEITSLDEDLSSDDLSIRKNKEIIKKADNLLLNRLENEDISLGVKDIIAMKSEAFKQIQTLEWWSDILDTWKLIPTNINIQIINK